MTADDDYAEDLRDWYAEDAEPIEPIDGYEPIPGFPHERYGFDNEVPSPNAPVDVARLFCNGDFHIRLDATEQTGDRQEADGRYTRRGPKTLIAWRGGWMIWRITHWAELDVAQLRGHIYRTLRSAIYEHMTKTGFESRPWNPDKRKVANVIEAMEAILHLSADMDTPSWIVHSAAETPAAQMISCQNGLLDLSTRTIHDHTPALFNVVSVPFAYNEDAPPPAQWFAFLESVWPDDLESVMLLQEYIGYILSGRTDMQKMLLLIGPTRSGKGTIARMLAALVGRGHVVGPTLASLGTNFGLSPLLGRPLAVVSDARLSGNSPTSTIVERLLSITGEDMLTVDRKYREPWSGKLPSRFVILSNELPKFRDASGAIANRLLILQMTKSFLGCEDQTLDARLADELPGILMWALEGLDRLVRNGRFTVPGMSADAANLMMDLASPMSAFVRDRCVRDVNATVGRDVLYDAWKEWAEDNGHHAGAKSTFGRDLRAVVPELGTINPRINGLPVRHYTHIGLQCQNLDGVYPASPASVSEPKGQGNNGDADKVSTILHQPTFADPDLMTDAGHPASDDGIKPQVNSGDAGDAGKGASKVQHRTANARYLNGQCRDCGVRPHSAGRPRCDECHHIWQTTVSGYER